MQPVRPRIALVVARVGAGSVPAGGGKSIVSALLFRQVTYTREATASEAENPPQISQIFTDSFLSVREEAK